MKEIAKKYSLYGLSVLPCKEDKSPDCKSWKKKIPLSDFEGKKGIGVKCGTESGGLECLDFDNHFGDAKSVISEFVDKISAIYEKYQFPIQATQSGGYHFLYRCNKYEGNQKLASKPVYSETRKKNVPDCIIETRGEGGYFCAAPTLGYKIIKGDILDIPTISVSERNFLIDVARSFNEFIPETSNNQSEFESTDKPGAIYNDKPEAISESINALKNAGWTEISTGLWRRPDKKEGISATFGRVAPNVFYCFTSNGYPFDENHGYLPFQIVSLLDYNGDFSSFAKDISERYDLKRKVDYTVLPKDNPAGLDLDMILSSSHINLEIPPEKPPICMMIGEIDGFNFTKRRLFTLGNFSAIIGKQKSKKTFLTSLICAAFTSNGAVEDKFYSMLPRNKRTVLRFDTEQSEYDAFKSGSVVNSLLGGVHDHYGVFCLREYDYKDRCRIIEYAIEKFKDSLGAVVIDGVADLCKSVNDEDDSNRVVQFLMTLSKKYNIHIVSIIHQNKGDNFATGHLGTFILRKAECVISVTKGEGSTSMVSCQDIRGVSEFSDFLISIDNSLPKVITNQDTSSLPENIIDY